MTFAGTFGLSSVLVTNAKAVVSGASTGFLPPLTIYWSSVFLGIGIATLIGAVSGLIPAFQASRLRIVDALRRVD